MPQISEQFWTDDRQAAERLNKSVVLFNGRPALVHDVFGGAASVSLAPKIHKRKQIPLDDPRWEKFRALPPIGWYNEVRLNDDNSRYLSALYVKRNAYRGRSHGLTADNTAYYKVGRDLGPAQVMRVPAQLLAPSVADGVQGSYPKFATVLSKCQRGRAMALSRKWCLFRRDPSLLGLYRKMRHVGYFNTNNQTLYLNPHMLYLVEEIVQDPCLPIENIREG